MSHPSPAGPIYDSVAAFWAELAACGVRHVAVSPGSRSTALAVTARTHPNLRVTVHLDERSAGFWALGLAKASRQPVALVCTSGTAAANYLPAVVEAHYSGVPLVVCTADRPAELREVGAGQTIDQARLYGSHVRWYAEMPIADGMSPDVADGFFRRAAVRAVTVAAGTADPGPVHLNWPFRKPLEPAGPPAAAKPAIGSPVLPARPLFSEDVAAVAALSGRRGLIVAGSLDLDENDAGAVLGFADAAGWPVLADTGSGLRDTATRPTVVSGADWVVRSPELAPEVLLRIGGAPSSSAVADFVASSEAPDCLLVDPRRRWEEPSFTWTTALGSDPARLLAAATPEMQPTDPAWQTSWSIASKAAWWKVEKLLLDDAERGLLLEPLTAATLARHLPAEVLLYVSNSMPVRDLTTFWPPDAPPRRVLAHRGANGIDGIVSAAAGAAASVEVPFGMGQPTAALLGDVALLHDVGGLLAAARAGSDLTLVVPNNNGGGIFSLLPVATDPASMHFEELFHTPHNTALAAFGELPGIRAQRVTNLDTLVKAVARPPSGVTLLEVPVPYAAALDQRRRIADLFA